MKANMKSKTWLALGVVVALFSTLNVYFLIISKQSGYVTHSKGDALRNNWPALESLLLKPTQRPVNDRPDLRPVALTNPRTDNNDMLVARKTVSPRAEKDKTIILKSEKTCPKLTMPIPTEDMESFQRITGTETFSYSAYLTWNRVRVIVLRKRTDPREFFCHLWSNSKKEEREDGDNLHVTKGFVLAIPEDHDREYLASYILCDLPPQLMDNPPIAVSVVYKERCSPPSNRLPVVLHKTQRYNFTVCVTPLNKNLSNTHMFVEMIEFNKLLGADRFVFYNHSIHSDIGKILQYYSELGLVDIRQWPTSLPKQVHYFGQLASLNDCLYRYKNQSRYIVFQDLDEFIIPKGKHADWPQLIAARQKFNPKFSVFQARCTFFRKEWPRLLDNFTRNDEVKKYQSIVLGHTLREGKILPYGHRSKYIINPSMVDTVGIHDTWVKSGQVDRMETNVALLYHYRNWEAPNDPQPRITDTFVAMKFGVPLLDRLGKAWESIRYHTGLV